MLEDGEDIHADLAVSNLEAIPAYKTLLKDVPMSESSIGKLTVKEDIEQIGKYIR